MSNKCKGQPANGGNLERKAKERNYTITNAPRRLFFGGKVWLAFYFLPFASSFFKKRHAVWGTTPVWLLLNLLSLTLSASLCGLFLDTYLYLDFPLPLQDIHSFVEGALNLRHNW